MKNVVVVSYKLLTVVLLHLQERNMVTYLVLRSWSGCYGNRCCYTDYYC